jgi:hypothetical protein
VRKTKSDLTSVFSGLHGQLLTIFCVCGRGTPNNKSELFLLEKEDSFLFYLPTE